MRTTTWTVNPAGPRGERHRPLPATGKPHWAATGFTLIEILVVVTIIGILALLVVPRFFAQVGSSKQAVAQQKIAVLENQVLVFQMNTGRLPTAQEGLEALLQAPADVSEKWRGPYVKEKDLVDPWGNKIMYRYPGRKNADFDIVSFGADGTEAGESDNADIMN